MLKMEFNGKECMLKTEFNGRVCAKGGVECKRLHNFFLLNITFTIRIIIYFINVFVKTLL